MALTKIPNVMLVSGGGGGGGGGDFLADGSIPMTGNLNMNGHSVASPTTLTLIGGPAIVTINNAGIDAGGYSMSNIFNINADRLTATGQVIAASLKSIGGVFAGGLITDVTDPVNDQDAATKKFVLDNISAGGANVALSNLAGVAINATLEPAAANTIDLGSSAKYVRESWVKSGRTNRIDFRTPTMTGDYGSLSSSSVIPLPSTNQATIALKGVDDTAVYSVDKSSGDNSGSIHVESGNTDSGFAGDVNIKTGDSISNQSGIIRLTTGTSGGSRGNIVTNSNNFNMTVANGLNVTAGGGISANISALQLHPNGASAPTIFLYDQTDTFAVGFKAQGATATTIYRLPIADGLSGQVLSTDGSAQMSWVTPSGGGGSGTSTVTSVTYDSTGMNALLTLVDKTLIKILPSATPPEVESTISGFLNIVRAGGSASLVEGSTITVVNLADVNLVISDQSGVKIRESGAVSVGNNVTFMYLAPFDTAQFTVIQDVDGINKLVGKVL